MKVTLPEKVRVTKKELIVYGIIIFICIICVIVAFYVQFYGRIDLGKLVGINQSENVFGTKSEEEIAGIKTNFENIFDNNITSSEDIENKKADKEKDIVYKKYERKETKLNSYDIEIHIPNININNEIINSYNNEIEDFYKKTEEILKSENRNIIYTVDYTANIQNGILSLIIKSSLKEGSNAQREIILAYNYDLRNNKEITLKEMLKILDLDENVVQEKIKTEVSEEQKQVEELKNLGYNIYSRDLNSEMYNIENIKQFYVTNNTLYIIFAYGNDANTSEMDLIVF